VLLSDLSCNACAGPASGRHSNLKCDGDIDGHDDHALCIDKEDAFTICDSYQDAYMCDGVVMHKTLNRAFLIADKATCSLQTTGIYDTYYAHTQTDAETGNDPVGHKFNLMPERYGFSYAEKLMFSDIQFTSGGNWKVCFCDSDSFGNVPDPCRSKDNFKIEVGQVHVSGVSCLLTNPELRKHSCVSQYYGGLRCYADGMAIDPTPPASIEDDHTYAFFEKLVVNGNKLQSTQEIMAAFWEYQVDSI